MSFTSNSLSDERVCKKCNELDGYTDDVSNAVIGVNHPPYYDGCRCFATYEIVGINK